MFACDAQIGLLCMSSAVVAHSLARLSNLRKGIQVVVMDETRATFFEGMMI